jgi:hypothetical protein
MDRFVDIEIVEWWDSTEVAGWCEIGETLNECLTVVTSIGYTLERGGCLYIVPHIACPKDQENLSTGAMLVPAELVKSRKKLVYDDTARTQEEA